MISKVLSGQTNLSKSFQSFFIETMELILTHTGRLNFTQMARCGRSCESRFRQNFRKSFDWLSFNRSFLESTKGHRIAIAIDPCYISKSGKKTPGIDWFWSGCAAAMKKGLEIFGISRIQDVHGCRLGCKPRTRGPCRRSLLKKAAAQRCNGGSIYCNVWKISEHAIK